MKAIILAVALLVVGIILLTLGGLHLRGHIYSKDGAVRMALQLLDLFTTHVECHCDINLLCHAGFGLVDTGFPDLSAR